MLCNVGVVLWDVGWKIGNVSGVVLQKSDLGVVELPKSLGLCYGRGTLLF